MLNETGKQTGASDGGPQRAAAALLGASSGSVLGLIVAGVIGALFKMPVGPPVALTGALSALLAAVMATLSARQKPPSQPPAPRAVWGVILTSAALLIALVVFLFQTAYVQRIQAAGERIVLPLAIWPVSRAMLAVSLGLAVLGVLAALAASIELMAKRGRYSAKWIAVAVLVGGAWAGLAAICYFMGRGFTLLG
jgi:hypothetical protein